MPKRGPKEITPQHKAAMAAGRVEGRAVKNYLEALEQHRPKRGRKRTPDSINNRLAKIDDELKAADVIKRLSLIQEPLDLLDELESLKSQTDISGLEAEFAKAAKGYGDRKGISYSAWREVGVPASVLKQACISRCAP